MKGNSSVTRQMVRHSFVDDSFKVRKYLYTDPGTRRIHRRYQSTCMHQTFRLIASYLTSSYAQWVNKIMKSSNGNIFQVTGPLSREFTSEFPSQRAVTRSFDSLICAWTNGWVSNREAGDLGRRWAHYDVIVMKGIGGLFHFPYSSVRQSHDVITIAIKHLFLNTEIWHNKLS